jgi:MFS family permease
MSPLQTTLILCLVEILGLIGIATFPALLPTFQTLWHLSHTEAGWISAVYYAGYIASVPFLVSATDRIDARRILVIGTVLGCLSSLAFAFLAGGFWSAALLRFFTGVSLAGIYMPGLKIVSDNSEGPLQSRFVSFYTASFGIGIALSFYIAGEISSLLTWRWAFGAAALGSAVALVISAAAAPASSVNPAAPDVGFRPDFRPVLKSRQALAYILGYAAHMWELFGLRSWIVAFLVYSQSLQPAGSFQPSATRIAFALSLIGLPASIFGNEAARRFGRRKTITIIMFFSCLLCVAIGFNPSLPFWQVSVLCLVYGVFLVGDSAALTAGAVQAAPEGYRGMTLALHSAVGFGAAFVGPLAVGIILDLFRPFPSIQWGMGFVCMALGCALGPFFLYRFASKGIKAE